RSSPPFSPRPAADLLTWTRPWRGWPWASTASATAAAAQSPRLASQSARLLAPASVAHDDNYEPHNHCRAVRRLASAAEAEADVAGTVGLQVQLPPVARLDAVEQAVPGTVVQQVDPVAAAGVGAVGVLQAGLGIRDVVHLGQ